MPCHFIEAELFSGLPDSIMTQLKVLAFMKEDVSATVRLAILLC